MAFANHSRQSVVSLLFLSSLFASGCAHDQYASDTSYHLGQINAPCSRSSQDGCVIQNDLRAIDQCVKIDTECAGGNQLLDHLFGDTRHKYFANYIFYFDQHDTKGTFANHRPVLMWNTKNTRYLYGVQEVYILLFTEYKTCFSAQITTISKNETNPFDAVLKALGKSLGPADTPIAPKTHTAELAWYPLSGYAPEPVMWLAVGSVPVEINTTDWITVQFKQPDVPAKPPGVNNTKLADATPNLPDDCIVGSLDSLSGGVKSQPTTIAYRADFLARNAFFSDNRANRVAVAVAFGLTFTGRNAGPEGSSDPNLNGYALAKVYPFRYFAPRLASNPTSNPGSLPYVRPSIGIVAGTNIGSPAFSELLVGVSVGHLFGNLGLIAGVNDFVPGKPANSASSAAATPEVGHRRGRPFVGVEYSF